MLEEAIAAVSSKKLSLPEEPVEEESWKFQVGKYYSGVDFEFAKVYMNAWVHFYLKDEYLRQFYNGAASVQEQQAILTGLIDEVTSKL
jgi:hypothetical protein